MKNNDNTRIWLKISEQVRTNPTKENKENRALNVQIICPKKTKVKPFLINYN